MASMQTGGVGLEAPISAWGGIWHQSAGDDQLYCASLVFPGFYFSLSLPLILLLLLLLVVVVVI